MLKERFFISYKCQFILSLWRGIYPYEYMDDCGKINETLLPEKEDFYKHLNMEDITDADCAHSKRALNTLK